MEVLVDHVYRRNKDKRLCNFIYWRYNIIIVKLKAIHHLHCTLDSGGDMGCPPMIGPSGWAYVIIVKAIYLYQKIVKAIYLSVSFENQPSFKTVFSFWLILTINTQKHLIVVLSCDKRTIFQMPLPLWIVISSTITLHQSRRTIAFFIVITIGKTDKFVTEYDIKEINRYIRIFVKCVLH